MLPQDKVLGSEQARSMAESITFRMDGFIGPQYYTFVQTDINFLSFVQEYSDYSHSINTDKLELK